MDGFSTSTSTTAEALSPILPRLPRDKPVTRSIVAALRDTDLKLGLLTRQQAEQMFAIERGPARKCRAWSDLLIEALLDYVVWGDRPTGVLTEEVASWLLSEVGSEPTPACLALLIAVLEEATTVPSGFQEAVRRRAIRAFAGDTQLDAAA